MITFYALARSMLLALHLIPNQFFLFHTSGLFIYYFIYLFHNSCLLFINLLSFIYLTTVACPSKRHADPSAQTWAIWGFGPKRCAMF